jgi:C4-type Zn-finger protein
MEGNKFPLTVELEDPSGNSFIKNPYAPSDDP